MLGRTVTDLEARTPDGEFGLRIEAEAWNEIDRLCTAAGRRETGGILVGSYTSDRSTALVTEAAPPPPDSSRGRWTFVRGVVGLRELLNRRWAGSRRRYYVGEWHFHPTKVLRPSADDIQQMGIIASTRSYRCEQPILVIVGMPPEDGAGRPARVFVFPHSCPIEMALVEFRLFRVSGTGH